MPSTFQLYEPHPSVPAGGKKNIPSGRGGAGNITSYKNIELTDGPTATGPAPFRQIGRSSAGFADSRLSVSTTSSAGSVGSDSSHLSRSTNEEYPSRRKAGFVMGGIGGYGNAKPSEERRIFSFDEELERERKLIQASMQTPVFHVGRGGAGNLVNPSRKKSDERASGSRWGSKIGRVISRD